MATLCEACGDRPATHTWVGEGGTLALIHGGGRQWCELCVVRAQLDYARKIAANIPALEQRLTELTM